METGFLDKNSILGWIISQTSGCYATKDKKVIQKLDRVFIFEKIKKLSIAHGQGYSQCAGAHQTFYLPIYFFRNAIILCLFIIASGEYS